MLLALISFIVYRVSHSSNGSTPATPSITGNLGQPDRGGGNPAVVGRTATVDTPVSATPAFCGVPLTGSVVVYLLDRGDATGEMLPALKDAALNSALSLGTDRKFQIVFWAAGADVTSFPESGTAYGSRESVADGKRAVEDVNGFGQTDVKPALATALADQADEIVLATGKGWTLDDEWVKDVMAARGSSTVRIDTFNLNGNGNNESAALRQLAEKTGGTYHDLANNELH